MLTVKASSPLYIPEAAHNANQPLLYIQCVFMTSIMNYCLHYLFICTFENGSSFMNLAKHIIYYKRSILKLYTVSDLLVQNIFFLQMYAGLYTNNKI